MISNSQLYYINSKSRLSGTNSNFTYQIDIDRNKNYTHVCCLQLSIPKAFYLVQDNKNFFTLQEGVISTSITIPPGNYNLNSFQTTLETQLNSLSPHAYTYTVSYPDTSINADTGKFTFSVSGNSGNQPSFIFTDYLYEQLGFDSGTYTFGSNILTSVNVINLQREGTLYLHSNIANNGSDSILQEVFSNNNPDFSNITYQCTALEGYSKQLSSSTNNIISFHLCDENGNEVYLEGQNLLCTLLIYQKTDIFTRLSDFIKYIVSKF